MTMLECRKLYVFHRSQEFTGVKSCMECNEIKRALWRSLPASRGILPFLSPFPGTIVLEEITPLSQIPWLPEEFLRFVVFIDDTEIFIHAGTQCGVIDFPPFNGTSLNVTKIFQTN